MKKQPTDIASILRYALCLLALLTVILLPELSPHAKASGYQEDVASDNVSHSIRLAHHES
ncbi:MAG TPA: hypothetical protein VL574_06960 [Stellaceae bacterium]|jgi:hypothetical protein|nr:hypothetical protein [Stellaceae bacterium]